MKRYAPLPSPARAGDGPSLPDRRHFVRTVALAGGGFVVAAVLPEELAASVTGGPVAVQRDLPFNAFVRVARDDTVTVVVKHLDKGQGVTTGLATIVAEEMDAAWSQMRSEFAPAEVPTYANLFFGVQGTGGSTSIANSWTQLRTAGAAARAMLVAAAEDAWGVAPGTVSVAAGVLRHEPSGRTATFGALAAAAARVTPPAEPRLKDPGEFRLIGTRLPRLDSAAKTDGSTVFPRDVRRRGLLEAVVAHPPKFGATVAKVDDAQARAIPGVVDVVTIPRGVAVLADSYWSATRGRDALTIEWDEAGAEQRGSAELFAAYRAALDGPGVVARTEGDAAAALAEAEEPLTLDFEFPFLAHATMEPMDCVIELGEDRCDVWNGAQLPTLDQSIVARILGLQPRQVVIHTLFAGGSFGRRAVPDSDYVAEAAMIVKAIRGRAPVKLHWSREDDMAAGRYRPMAAHRLRGAVDGAGGLGAWHHRIAVQSFLRGSLFEAMIVDGVDATAVEGARGLPYAIGNMQVEQHLMTVGVPGLWWRSVGHSHNAYATEVFFDQLAHRAGRDPFELRRELLADKPRHRAVLELAAAKAGWGSPLAPGRGRGIAVHESFSSYVAEVAEVTVGDDGRLTVDRVVCAVDCGIAVNPDVVRAQMEGGIAYGLSAFLREAVTLEGGVVQERNFDRYRPLRIDEMPKVEVHIVPSAEAPTGVGEPGTPPIAPAVANAIFAATGKVITRLPLGDQLRQA